MRFAASQRRALYRVYGEEEFLAGAHGPELPIPSARPVHVGTVALGAMSAALVAWLAFAALGDGARPRRAPAVADAASRAVGALVPHTIPADGSAPLAALSPPKRAVAWLRESRPRAPRRARARRVAAPRRSPRRAAPDMVARSADAPAGSGALTPAEQVRPKRLAVAAQPPERASAPAASSTAQFGFERAAP